MKFRIQVTGILLNSIVLALLTFSGCSKNLKQAEDLFYKAKKMEAERDYAGAINELNKAIELVPDSAKYYTERALAKLFQGNTTGSMEDLDEALKVGPGFVNAYILRGFIKDFSSDWGGAMVELDEAIMNNPKILNVHLLRGKCAMKILMKKKHAQNNSWDENERLKFNHYVIETASYFDQEIALNPRCAEAYYLKGLLLEDNYYYRKGIELGINPDTYNLFEVR